MGVGGRGGAGRGAEGLYKSKRRPALRTNAPSAEPNPRVPLFTSVLGVKLLVSCPSLRALLFRQPSDGGSEVRRRVVGGRVRAGVRRARDADLQRGGGRGHLDGGELAGKREPAPDTCLEADSDAFWFIALSWMCCLMHLHSCLRR